MLRRHTQANDRKSRNVLYDHVLEAGNIHTHILQYHHFQRHPNGWIYSCTILLMFGSHARHPLHHPVVKTLEGFLQPGGQNPRLRHKQKHHMYHHNIKLPTVLISALSLPKIFASRNHFPRALRRFRSTTGQLLLEDNSVNPRYWNKETNVRGVPYSKKTLPICPSIYSTSNLCRFLSVLHRYIRP